jgi:hypothetical protein
MGMRNTLRSVKHMLVELQIVQYNIGTKTISESIPFIESLGFEIQPARLINEFDRNLYYCGNGPDSDYHFMKK